MTTSYFLYAILALFLAKKAAGESIMKGVRSVFANVLQILHLLLFLILIEVINTNFGHAFFRVTLSVILWLIIYTLAVTYLYKNIKKY